MNELTNSNLKNYIVAIDIEICGETIKHYIEVKAESPDEAHKKAVECINGSVNILVEKKPIEEI